MHIESVLNIECFNEGWVSVESDRGVGVWGLDGNVVGATKALRDHADSDFVLALTTISFLRSRGACILSAPRDLTLNGIRLQIYTS